MSGPVIEAKVFGFGLKGLKKFPELIPLVFLLGLPCTWAFSYMGYALYQKSDVIINKSKESPPWERVNPEERQKFLTFNMKYEKIPELEQLRKEIGSYKYGK